MTFPNLQTWATATTDFLRTGGTEFLFLLNAPPNPRNPSRPRCQAGAVEHTAYVKAELQTKFDFISDLLEMLLVVCPTTVPSPPHPMDRTTVNLPFKSA